MRIACGNMAFANVSAIAPKSIAHLIDYARRFELRLAEAKTHPLEEPFRWYAYDTFASLDVLAPLLKENFAAFRTGLESGRMLDIGCGDGDLAYLFASLGYEVTAIDLPKTNYNWMTGVRTLRDRLALPIEIQEMDIDSQFEIQEDRYGLALLLGILYHLKNPFQVLEMLARRVRYCLLSTRVAARTATGTFIREEPLAYLLDRREVNNDPTNYWVFSHQGLLRLVRLAGWRVLGWRTVGCTKDSTPTSSADERMFLFLRSQLRSAPARIRLLDGWTAPGPHGWAWVEKRFSFEVDVREERRPESFLLGFEIPEGIAAASPVEVQCTVNGFAAGSEIFRSAGEKLFEKRLPRLADHRKPMTFEFAVQHSYDPRPDLRDLGVIVPFTGAIHGIDSQIAFWLD
jgi:tRNA (mo5U34)-methyltransferase